MVGSTAAPSAYTGPSSGNLQILCAADASAYATATGGTWAAPEFKSIKFVDKVEGNVTTTYVVATFDATIVVADPNESQSASFGVMTANGLDTTAQGYAADTLTGVVSPNDDQTVDGDWKVEFVPPAGDALFIQGFTDVPNAGN